MDREEFEHSQHQLEGMSGCRLGKKPQVSQYSMTSSVVPRSEGMKLSLRIERLHASIIYSVDTCILESEPISVI